ncbi:glucan endo-1,3-beta-glucosidase 7 [Pyrus ussuriensis x Pyrus communis]|uniref:Glucan endo-1,3-beta-glucosidase 7 n=1 Tax=Pyrus ussuriensis x Pyrus communis TaxID=2448454 RepID=A0A5N5I667_9ROSA|nr:glucan endo-1,3-beta-glucosidase 7 [Pyrus ussuriensis x Pyrus communis]
MVGTPLMLGKSVETYIFALYDEDLKPGSSFDAIQPGGACFDLNTVALHAAYAMNLYYHTGGTVPVNCDFSQIAMLTSSNPSYNGCSYPGGSARLPVEAGKVNIISNNIFVKANAIFVSSKADAIYLEGQTPYLLVLPLLRAFLKGHHLTLLNMMVFPLPQWVLFLQQWFTISDVFASSSTNILISLETIPGFPMQPECQICQRRGHTTPNCFYRSSNSEHNFQECQICGKRGHIAVECYHRGNHVYQGSGPTYSASRFQTPTSPAFSVSTSSSPNLNAMSAHTIAPDPTEHAWIMDTGASHHMTLNVNNLTQVQPFEGSEMIKIGNGQGQGNKGDTVPRQESSSKLVNCVVLDSRLSHPLVVSLSSMVSQQPNSGSSSVGLFEQESETFTPITYSIAIPSFTSALLPVLHPAQLQKAMQEKYDALQTQGTWVLVPSSPDRLVKSLYGLKQAHQAWHSKFTEVLPALGFVVSQYDTILFVKHDGTHIVVLLLYVDDIIITGSSDTQVQSVINTLGELFELKDMGKLTYFFGLHIQSQDSGDLFVNQTKYIMDLLKKAGMDKCILALTSSKPQSQLLVTEGTPLPDVTLYHSLVGALQYLTFTRPDIAHSVGVVCQFMHQPTDAHFFLVKRILRYIKGTLTYGLTYKVASSARLSAYSDSNWWDNLSTLALSTNPVFHSRIKHLDTDYHFERKKVQKSDLLVQYVPTTNQVADVFTKELHIPVFVRHCYNLNLGVPG